VNTINGQSAAKPLSSLEYEEGSTTIETATTVDKGVEYTKNSGKGRDLNKVYIYALTDPNNNAIRYIGKTVNIKQRLAQHLKDNSKSYKASWLKSLKDNNQICNIEIIDIVDKDGWEFWEIYWIEQYKIWGCELTNLTKGGIGHKGYKKTELQKKNLSDKLKNRTLSIESRKKISIARKGIVFSKKHLENLSKSHKGLKYNSENYGKHVQRKIIQFSIDNKIIKIWNSIKEASIYYNVNQSSISHCCAGRKKTIKGFIWKYLD
jgi:group I intron endonuclease